MPIKCSEENHVEPGSHESGDKDIERLALIKNNIGHTKARLVLVGV